MSKDSPVQDSDPHLLTHGGKLEARKKSVDYLNMSFYYYVACLPGLFVCLTLMGMLRLWFHCGLAFFSRILVQT